MGGRWGGEGHFLTNEEEGTSNARCALCSLFVGQGMHLGLLTKHRTGSQSHGILKRHEGSW